MPSENSHNGLCRLTSTPRSADTSKTAGGKLALRSSTLVEEEAIHRDSTRSDEIRREQKQQVVIPYSRTYYKNISYL